jgi:hypothetical protein
MKLDQNTLEKVLYWVCWLLMAGLIIHRWGMYRIHQRNK